MTIDLIKNKTKPVGAGFAPRAGMAPFRVQSSKLANEIEATKRVFLNILEWFSLQKLTTPIGMEKYVLDTQTKR